MKKFSINDLERFSGVKAHTIRTWEQRHQVLTPERNNGNYRHYSLSQAKELLDLAVLNRNGYRISFLSNLSPVEIAQKLYGLTGDENQQQIAVNKLIVGMYALDIEGVEAVFDKCFITWPATVVINQVVLPFLHKVELFWQGNQLCEEHFMVTIVRKKILWSIEKAGDVRQGSKAVLLFLPGTKQLDLALLCVHYHLKLHGFRVLYMGNDVSVLNLKTAFEKIKPDYLYTYLSRKDNFQINELASLMKAYLPGSKLLFTAHSKVVQTPTDGNILQMGYHQALDFIRS